MLPIDDFKNWPGKEVRQPSIYNPNYLVYSKQTGLICDLVNLKLKQKELIVLDVGCGNKPYYPLFASISGEYIGVDLTRHENVDVIADAENLPFCKKSLDLIVSFVVLEHVSNPFNVISEVYESLKDDGDLILSAPGVYPFHGPPDFWRFTDDGIRKILSKFVDVDIFPSGGSIVCLVRLINLYIDMLRVGKLKYVFFAFNNILGLSLDRMSISHPFLYKFLIGNYVAFARKQVRKKTEKGDNFG